MSDSPEPRAPYTPTRRQPPTRIDSGTVIGQLVKTNENLSALIGKTTATTAPDGVYIDITDAFFVQSYNSQSPAGTFSLIGTIVDESTGREVQFLSSTSLTMNTNRSTGNTFVNAPLTGWLKSVTVLQLAGGSPLRGQTFFAVWLLRGGKSNANIAYHLCRGYFSASIAPKWDTGTGIYEDMRAGPGFIYNPQPGNPGTGSEILITVPLGALWKVKLLRLKFVTNGNASNRTPFLRVQDPTGSSIFYEDFNTTQTANQFGEFNFAENAPRASMLLGGASGSPDSPTVNSEQLLYFPPELKLPANSKIATFTPGIQTGGAGDAYVILGMLVEEWLDT